VQSPLSRLAAVNWDFPDSDRGNGIHSVHPYPARFIPELPRALISTLPIPLGTAVLDPFCGSGATLVEALSAGHPAIGIDVNPIACLISRVKCNPLTADIASLAQAIAKDASSRMTDPAIPPIPNLDHWFPADVQRAVARLVALVGEVPDEPARDALRLALSSILVRVSYQESDTRYAAVPKDTSAEFAYSQFVASAAKIWSHKRSQSLPSTDVSVLCQDTLASTPADIGRPIGLVVTSPPYPNAYEYWLYHKYRMYWLGYDPKSVKAREIGARAHYFTSKPPSQRDFIANFQVLFSLLDSVLVPSGFICVVIGPSKIHGTIVDNAALITSAAKGERFRVAARFPRTLARNRKSFNLSHARIQTEEILVFTR